MEDIDLTKLTSLPFQTQITYKNLDGSKCVRVISKQLEISDNRDQLEKQADYQIIGTNAISKTSNMARKGNFREA